jgi:DtxR family Mn-dependent transcriptional regulator
MNSLTEENYLKAIFHLIDDEQNVTINELKQISWHKNAICE